MFSLVLSKLIANANVDNRNGLKSPEGLLIGPRRITDTDRRPDYVYDLYVPFDVQVVPSTY